MRNDLFDQAISQIEREYKKLNHKLGWRFLCVPMRVLQSDPDIALITANPGGSSIPADHPTASCEHGCAYLVEKWKNAPPGEQTLQRQVQLLFDAIAQHTHYAQGGAQLMESSLIGYFIPFRSPTLDELPHRKESQAFAHGLWLQVFRRIHPKLIITIDPDAYRAISRMLLDSEGARTEHNKLQTGWGNVAASIDQYSLQGRSTTLVRLPHLSRFKLFTSAKCEPFVDMIMTKACERIAETDGSN